jgi:hypothetical protein
MLPILSVLLILPAQAASLFPSASEQGARDATNLLGLPLTLFVVGWTGTQRIWYQRLFEGQTLSSAEVWQITWKFFGRYLVLGLIVAIPIFLGLLGVLAQVALTGEPRHSFPFPIWWYPIVIAYGFLTDVLLTFVTSALAYTTNRVRVAWSIGIKLITQTWPASAAYTFVPPITLLAFATLNPVGFPAPVVVLLAVISTLIGLLVKGAIAAFYLRHAALLTTGGEAQLRA